MEEAVRQDLLAKTRRALDAADWDADGDGAWQIVERLWQPWVNQDDAEAEFQLAYHYLWCTPCDDDATRDRMKALVRKAAAKDHPDAIWFLVTGKTRSRATNPEFERELLRAGQLGSVNAQRELGVKYATGEWSGPKDLTEAARWYRLAAENGNAESQYDLGFMLLLGEGVSKHIEEGLEWLERAGNQGECGAFRLLVDCYANGICDVPVDLGKAAFWRGRMEEYERLHPPPPRRSYTSEKRVDEASLEFLWDIDGVVGFAFGPGQEFSVSYNPTLVTPGELDENISAAGFAVVPIA